MSASGCACRRCAQSCKIIKQALKKLPDGPFITGNRKVAPPPKEELAYSMESLIHHFKLWTEGFTPPKGEVYVRVESPRGEFGCYLNSDGTPKPRRVHFRTPSFANLSRHAHDDQGCVYRRPGGDYRHH